MGKNSILSLHLTPNLCERMEKNSILSLKWSQISTSLLVTSCAPLKKYHRRFMLLALPVVVVVVLFVAFQEQWLAWGILCVCSNDAILDDVLSSSQCSSSCRVSSVFWIAVDIRGLVAYGISSPWLSFIWVVSYCLWWHLPLCCQSIVVWEVACVLIPQVWFWCIPLCVPWCIVPQVLLWWLMTWRSWWCAQCLILRHCLVVWWCRLVGKSVPWPCCMLWVHSSSLCCCVLLIPYRWRDKRVLHPPV